jgi:hypothetical protein
MRVTALGHSGLWVEAAGERILIDPILRDGPFARGLLAIDPPRRLHPAKLPRPTALAFTHAHTDHFDPPSLARLDRGIPVIAPPDAALRAQLLALGFRDVRTLAPGRALALGALRLEATRSLKPRSDEIGLVVAAERACFWNIADTEVDASVARAARGKRAAIDVVAARFQPIRRVLDGLTSGAGGCFDKRDVVRWLEAACAVKPRAVFPYGSGLSLLGRPSWLNRYLFPFSEDEIARLLDERLGGAGRAFTLQPGDVIEVSPASVQQRTQFSAFVGLRGRSRRPAWEPIDRASLGTMGAAARRALVTRLEAMLAGPFARWLTRELARPRGVFAGFVEWRVVWQLVVHLGRDRALYSVDFGTRPWRLLRGSNPRANFFFHCSGEGLDRVLRRKGGAEWLLSAGDNRFCEKIIAVKQGRLAAPREVGAALHARLPDPFLLYLANCEL